MKHSTFLLLTFGIPTIVMMLLVWLDNTIITVVSLIIMCIILWKITDYTESKYSVPDNTNNVPLLQFNPKTGLWEEIH